MSTGPKSLGDVVDGMKHGDDSGCAVMLTLKHIVVSRIKNHQTYDSYSNAFLQDYDWMGSIVSHYFRMITNILRFVANNDRLSYEETKKYAEMFKAHLSDDELTVLFGYCIAFEEEEDELYELVKLFHVFEYMPTPVANCGAFVKEKYEELGVVR
ncbi:putative phage abortive infection protein [Terasakiella sp. A23]|uniref:putative phage abortive infection protein n=1 Tax=Terasakiella sp. FCG-A23 TaxID=3080561 RepID=UPI002954C445|nr:putative phage abortive infection protein [Terasakiella sp. A23]MDV7341864.1 putative phage abortive infection protein [Terasakiella sp. A23]